MKDFLQRLKRQDEAALDHLIDAYMPLLKGICGHILIKSCGRGVADECLNDVLLSIWQRSGQFDGSLDDFRKWAGTIAKYKAIDTYRRHIKRQQREAISQYVPDSGGHFTTEEAVMRKEARDEMLYRLHTLAEADRDLFLMKYYLDLSNGEIAETLGITLSAVENRLYRGKRKLGRVIGQKERLL